MESRDDTAFLSPRPRHAVRLWLSLIAHNLRNWCRRRALRKIITLEEAAAFFTPFGVPKAERDLQK